MQPLFINLSPDADSGPERRFAVLHTPAHGEPKGLVLYVHPWAEEMNKSRRMAALQARALAEDGFAVLQPDLLGCGNSEGDLSDATWPRWLDDVTASAAWLQQRLGSDKPLWLWGQRLGALLAAQAADRLPRCDGLLFWQPSTSGKTVLQQFLRLKTAGQLASGGGREAAQPVRQQLAAGQTLEIAGYRLSPALAQGLEGAALKPPARPCRVEWLEVGPPDAQDISPAAQQAAGRWREAGCAVRAQVVGGPSFWQTVEIEDAPALITATRAAMADSPSSSGIAATRSVASA